MAMRDDLCNNQFFKLLQTTYSRTFEKAQKKSWVICVPQQNSLKGVRMSQEFIDSHVLKPSPFFKSHYTSTDSHQSKTFELEDGVINLLSGGKIRIISEEIGYNEDYKPFRILVIEQPLTSNRQEKVLKRELSYGSTTSCAADESGSLSLDCQKLFKAFPQPKQMLDKRIKQFCSSYMVLPDYLHDASVKLHGIVEWAVEVFTGCCRNRIPQDECIISEIAPSVESYILSRVHNKIYPVVKKKLADEDEQLTDKLMSLYETHLTPDQLGVKEIFCCPTPSAVVELASLDLKKSPVEKLYCLLSTLDLLNQDIEKSLSETYSAVNPNNDVPRLSSDDLIPLLLALMVQTRPLYLASNLYYIQNFCWYFSMKDKFSFSLVTFQAAKEYLKSTSFSLLKPSAVKVKKEMSLEELMMLTVEMQQDSSEGNSKEKVRNSQSTIDHQLENITKLIEASTREHRQCIENEN